MRQVINISLPAPMTKLVKKATKDGNYASVSEFFRDLFRQWEENKLYQQVMESEREFAAGKYKVLKSFADLDK